MKIQILHDLIQAEKLISVGHIHAVCGRNNSGKSTLLRAIETGRIATAEALEPKGFDAYALLARANMASSYGGDLQYTMKAVADTLVRLALDGEWITSGDNLG